MRTLIRDVTAITVDEEDRVLQDIEIALDGRRIVAGSAGGRRISPSSAGSTRRFG